MVSTPCPSTSFRHEEGISGKELNQLMSIEPHSTCILDCREGGSDIRSASRYSFVFYSIVFYSPLPSF